MGTKTIGFPNRVILSPSFLNLSQGEIRIVALKLMIRQIPAIYCLWTNSIRASNSRIIKLSRSSTLGVSRNRSFLGLHISNQKYTIWSISSSTIFFAGVRNLKHNNNGFSSPYMWMEGAKFFFIKYSYVGFQMKGLN